MAAAHLEADYLDIPALKAQPASFLRLPGVERPARQLDEAWGDRELWTERFLWARPQGINAVSVLIAGLVDFFVVERLDVRFVDAINDAAHAARRVQVKHPTIAIALTPESMLRAIGIAPEQHSMFMQQRGRSMDALRNTVNLSYTADFDVEIALASVPFALSDQIKTLADLARTGQTGGGAWRVRTGRTLVCTTDPNDPDGAQFARRLCGLAVLESEPIYEESVAAIFEMTRDLDANSSAQ